MHVYTFPSDDPYEKSEPLAEAGPAIARNPAIRTITPIRFRIERRESLVTRRTGHLPFVMRDNGRRLIAGLLLSVDRHSARPCYRSRYIRTRWDALGQPSRCGEMTVPRPTRGGAGYCLASPRPGKGCQW